MSDLRTRIAAVIARHRMDRSNYEMADAVIAELGLRQEWGIRERGEPEPGWLADTRDKLAPKLRPAELLMRRHITDWESDDA